MNNSMKRFLSRNETLVGIILVAFCIFTGFVEPSFFTIGSLFDLSRNAVVIGILAMGLLVVLVSGGIDVSFTAIAAFSMYATTQLLIVTPLGESFLSALLLATLVGFSLGMVNAIFIGLLRLPTLIVTLGTLSLFHGFLLAFIGTKRLTNLPEGMLEFSKSTLVQTIGPDGAIFALPTAVLFLIGSVLLTWFILQRTMLGRGIYALGGSPVAAERTGFNVPKLQFFIYGYVGALAGVAGVIHASLVRIANPSDLVGLVLTVIAAVVIGGARLFGGRGTVIGTVIGVALIVVINNSLILLGIPSYWQRVVIGLLILLGTGVPAFRAKLAERRGGSLE